MTTPKIATCCYCGTRAALVLRGETRHELSCARCGAPLHDLKRLRTDREGRGDRIKPSPLRGAPKPKPKPRKRRKPARRRKGLGLRIFEEALDIIEDILD